MEIYLDSDILIDFLRGEKETVSIVGKLEEGYDLATTSINLFELYFGAYKTGRAGNIRAVDELAERLEISDLTKKSAMISAKIIAELESAGKAIDVRDALIAGVVVENKASLLTKNTKHFSRISQLRLFEMEM